jgi:endonuclease YncB( thermonuclease family)
MNRLAKYFLALFLVITLFLNACDDLHFSETYEGKVIKVSDGDSLNIIQQGKVIRVRLAEIDAPEYKQPFWKKSRNALEGHVAGKTVLVEEFDRDQYGRIVGHIYVDDLWVNGALVKDGFAYVYERYAVSQKLFQYQTKAEKERRGIWKLPENQRIRPWEWRKKNR